ncbi:MAG TPA: cation:proton antiporter [Gemmatimonadales bacterium]|nr:cation:proton antiporter [Gemmatimonadales bacterium]
MPHDVSLIAAVAAGFGLALALGLAAQRLGIPPLVGYLVAGILIGPATPGYVADIHLTQQLAELGVMLMMFGVGLHFSLDDLLAVRRIALPGALVQMTVATVLGAATAVMWGWSLGAGLVLGLALSVASTVVLLRGLESRGVLASVDGRIAVGWLVVEDLAVVLILVLLPALASQGVSAGASGDALRQVGVTAAKVAAFVLLMLVAGRRALPGLLWFVARTGSRELFTLAVISAAVGVAFASAKLFSVSYALGAFFAGMLLRESALSHRAAEESLPLRDAFSVLFFVSVGMLFEPSIVLREPLKLAAVLGIVLVGKTAAAVLLVRAFRYSLGTAFTVGAGLAQIGEFSFIVAALGRRLDLLPADGESLIVAAALISITLNPFFFAAAEAARTRFPPDSGADPLAELPGTVSTEALSGHVVIVGHGRVGRRIAEALIAERIPLVVAEQNREEVERLRARKVLAVAGDATEPAVLIQAHIVRAAVLVVATPDASRIRRMVETARALNPRVEVLLRTHTEAETELLRRDGMGTVFMGEAELARSMTERIVRDWTARRAEAESLT